jgi:hypothetical protein
VAVLPILSSSSVILSILSRFAYPAAGAPSAAGIYCLPEQAS